MLFFYLCFRGKSATKDLRISKLERLRFSTSEIRKILDAMPEISEEIRLHVLNLCAFVKPLDADAIAQCFIFKHVPFLEEHPEIESVASILATKKSVHFSLNMNFFFLEFDFINFLWKIFNLIVWFVLCKCNCR